MRKTPGANIHCMCYSAQVQEAYDEYCAEFGADIDIKTYSR